MDEMYDAYRSLSIDTRHAFHSRNQAHAFLPTMGPGAHANLSPATRNWQFSVLDFCDTNTGICAGAISPYFLTTTRI